MHRYVSADENQLRGARMAIGAGIGKAAYAAVGPIRKCVTDLRITVDRTYSEIWGQIRNAFSDRT